MCARGAGAFACGDLTRRARALPRPLPPPGNSSPRPTTTTCACSQAPTPATRSAAASAGEGARPAACPAAAGTARRKQARSRGCCRIEDPRAAALKTPPQSPPQKALIPAGRPRLGSKACFRGLLAPRPPSVDDSGDASQSLLRVPFAGAVLAPQRPGMPVLHQAWAATPIARRANPGPPSCASWTPGCTHCTSRPQTWARCILAAPVAPDPELLRASRRHCLNRLCAAGAGASDRPPRQDTGPKTRSPNAQRLFAQHPKLNVPIIKAALPFQKAAPPACGAPSAACTCRLPTLQACGPGRALCVCHPHGPVRYSGQLPAKCTQQ
jgi:hypothetical protein